MVVMVDVIASESLAHRLARHRLKNSHLFKGLPDAEIDRIAELFTIDEIASGTQLFREGSRGDSFFFVLEGSVAITRRVGDHEELLTTMTDGDFFGEGALLFGNLRRASVTTLQATSLLRMDREAFNLLLRRHPDIRQELVIVSQGYDIARRKQFDWLMEDEGLHMLARKHPMILFFAEVPVVLLGLLSLTMMYYGAKLPMTVLLYAGIAALVASIGWGFWRYIDWGDDYYIVTDKRVVWLEETFLLYESIQEARLTEVRSVDISTDFIQRTFGYGDLHIRTYTGNIIMRNVGQPERFKSLIEEYWHRALEYSRHIDNEEIDTRLREKLGLPQPKRPKRRQTVSIAEQRTAEKDSAAPLTQTMFTNFLKMRYVEGDTIVYRKHWFLLLVLIWQPSLGLLALLTGGVYLLVNFPDPALTMIFVVALIALLGWWIYKYWDWRDDRYEVSSVSITDLDRTPLGREKRQTAPLENILSLEHERVGFLGILFNFGTVSINVGDKTYEFEGVHDPARVRQEISDRQQARRKQLERERISSDEERQLDWLARYHRNARELWERQEEEELEEDGFELK